MAERYVRPPLVGSEPRRQTVAIWRFRLLLAIVMLAIALGVVLLTRFLTQPSEGNPGFDNAAAVAAVVSG